MISPAKRGDLMNVLTQSNRFSIVKRLQPIGGSLAILLPSYATQKMNFNPTSQVKLTVEGDKLIIENFV